MKWLMVEVAKRDDWDNGGYRTVWVNLPCDDSEIKSALLSLETADEDWLGQDWEDNWDYDFEKDKYIIVDYETDSTDPMEGADKYDNILELNAELKRERDYWEERGIF
jgi:hypothetical protein